MSYEKWEENEGGNVREGKGSVGGGVPVNPDVEAIVYLKTKAIYPRNLFIREPGFWLSAIHRRLRIVSAQETYRLIYLMFW